MGVTCFLRWRMPDHAAGTCTTYPIGYHTDVGVIAPDRNDTMAKSYREITSDVSRSLAKLRADIPDTTRGFSALAQAATRDGALDRKTKELIAMALSVAARCDACLGFHAEALVKLKASRAELEEALGMAIYMGGGPSLMYAADALAAYEEFGGQTALETTA